MRPRSFAAAVTVLAIVGVACGGGATGDEVVVGAIYPTGGSQGPGGVEEYRGLQLAADYANDHGGVGGRSVRVELAQADTADAVPDALASLADQGIQVVAGSYGSTLSIELANLAEQQDVLVWETGAVGELGMATTPGSRFFRFAPNGASLGTAAIGFVRERVAPGSDQTRYAVTFVDDVYGRAVAEGAVAEIERRGLDLVAEIPYRLTGVSIDDVDFDAIAEQVAASDADVLMVVAYLADGVAIRRAVLRNGVELDAMIGTSSSYCMPEFGRILGDEAVGVFASDKPSGDVLDPASLRPEAASALKWARDAYLDRFGEPMSAPALTGFAGGLALFGHVLPNADSLSPADVAAAAVATRLPAGSLPNGSGLQLAPAGQPGAGSNLLATSVIWEWVAPGQREVVWPPEFATGRLVVDAA